MNISFAVPVCNERLEIERLLGYLIKNKKKDDEIIILMDEENVTKEVEDFVEDFVHLYLNEDNVYCYWNPLRKDFSQHKNCLNGFCKGDYIFQIDADEIPQQDLMENIHEIVEQNEVDVIWIPRINLVHGLDQEHIQKWGWRLNEKNYINWPDYQARVYRNTPDIKWENKVHEKLTGHKTEGHLVQEELALLHIKEIDRQEKQNKFYSEI